MAERRASRRETVCSALTSIRSLLDTVLLLVILGLVMDRQWQKSPSFEIGGDITGFAPTIPQQIKTFVPDPMFIPEQGSEFFTEAVRSSWLSIVPRGLGYVRINNTKEYNNLPNRLQFYPESTFTTSVTHQLHCLHSMVEVVAAYTSNQLDKLPAEGAWHLSHCFEYLRQSIMCCGDVALEGQHTTFPPNVTGSDGWDAKHVCRDYGQVLEHLERNRADDERWI
ncbi:Oxidase ustYa [Madurella fahalii]|uniref:Oxidase ustYa n=1 Tax=Madurella fahalii TaxID=1157608 RepID=A0ABQ0G4Y8_9PEZI